MSDSASHPRTLRPVPSYSSFTDTATTTGSLNYAYVSAQPSLPSTSQESLLTAATPNSEAPKPAPRSRQDTSSSWDTAEGEPAEERVAGGPQLRTELSYSTFTSSFTASSSTGSDLVMSATGPYPSPFYVPPPPRPVVSNKENITSPVRTAIQPSGPRPISALFPLPPKSSSTVQHLRAPSKSSSGSSSLPYRAPPLTAHTSLAAFKAHHHLDATPRANTATAKATSSDDSHRTSSDVDLDLSFDYEPRQDVGDGSFEDESAPQSETGSGAGGKRMHKEAEWVGIDMRPLVHGIPEGQLVRSSSGKLVGAQSARARSAVDLRAQFKAAEQEQQARDPAQTQAQEVAIVMMEELNVLAEDGADEARRREIRTGKQPAEGERAAWIRTSSIDAGLPAGVDAGGASLRKFPEPLKPTYRRSVGKGFTYNATESLYTPPHSAPASAPPQYQSSFPPAEQDAPSPFSAELEQAKRTKTFPLPLRLVHRTKRSAAALTASSPVLGSFFGGSKRSPALDSETETPEPSPIFDTQSEFDREGEGEGTVRTAPSTPNDTPLMQECFDEDETTPPLVPNRDEALAGLGFDFGTEAAEAVDEFPVVPLRQSRRVSLPPPATKRLSIRHAPIPSLSISPPSRCHDALDDIIETASTSSSSQDSAVDPTVSPSRRLSRRLSSSAATRSRPTSTIYSSPDTSSPRRLFMRDGPTVRTPQHLLTTPTPSSDRARSPSFSFSPAPLQLVKAQLLRAAGYGVVDTSQQVPSAASAITHEPAHAGSPKKASPRQATPQDKGGKAVEPLRARSKMGMLDDVADMLSSSAETWIDEVVPAKLAFIAGFLLGPWCWILGGWYLRALDGELRTTRGQRCRDPSCSCGRILRGSAARQQQEQKHQLQLQHSASNGSATAGGAPDDADLWAGLDKWVFVNRVAAGSGGVTVAVLVAVAIWAATSA
ncbi:hypothetical protein JCM1841_001536 [Sporobolomyces salmonicolor]